jgi:hypothetical protein
METIHTRAAPLFQETEITAADLALINTLAPKPLRADQVYIRSMYLCSSQLCISDGCRFSRQALEEITQKVIGQSVLTGHNRSSLPLARFFKAIVVPRGENEEGESIFFVQAWFYWLRDTSGAKDLLLNIDGGVYREVSLAWKFNQWRCSICDAQNGMCSHRVGERYNEKLCYRWIDHIVDVLEGSLVYKSADRYTCLSAERSEAAFIEEEPVLLICERNDPLLAWFESEQLLSDRLAMPESSSAFAEGVNCIWLRRRFFCDSLRNVEPFLSEEGICLVEHVPNPLNEELFGEFAFFGKKNAESATMKNEKKHERGGII